MFKLICMSDELLHEGAAISSSGSSVDSSEKGEVVVHERRLVKLLFPKLNGQKKTKCLTTHSPSELLA